VSAEYKYIQYDSPRPGVAAITLNRPRQRNAQSRVLLVELGDAFDRAEADDEVRVVVLRGAGDVFSSGHDLGSSESIREREPGPDQHISFRQYGGTMPPLERQWRQEWQFFLSNTRRWRDLRKITIAAVQGPVYAAGLMLAWACDFIVADESTVFADVIGTRLGMCGVEYFAHPWEFGTRKAKELLLTGDSISAQEAHRLGMVSKIFPASQLHEASLDFADRIAQVPSATALMIKEAVNQTQDNQGFYNSLQAAFTLHELNHAHWLTLTNGQSIIQTPELGAVPWREAPEVRPLDPFVP
jgi:enoyl-CoA hydratase